MNSGAGIMRHPDRRGGGGGSRVQANTMIATPSESAVKSLNNNNDKKRQTYANEIPMVSTLDRNPKRLPRTSPADMETLRNDPAYKPGRHKHSYGVHMRRQPHEERIKRYAKSEYVVTWRESQDQALSVKITDTNELTSVKSKKVQEIKDVEHLIIEDEDRKLKELPTSISSLKNMCHLSVKYAKIKAVPQWMAANTTVTQLSIEETYLSKIEVICKMNQLKTLDLSRNKITFLPKQIQELVNLVELKLAGNAITTVPGEIHLLQKLTKLDLSSNKIQFLPNELFHLKNLRSLDVSRNVIEKLPEGFGNMESLIYLTMSHNRLSILPSSVQALQGLKHLTVANNRLKVIQKGIGYLESLDHLNMRNNNIITIEDFPQFVKIALLDCNSLKDIEMIGHKAQQLEVLSIKENELKHIPRSVTEIRRLKALYIDGNPVENIPAEIGEGPLRHLTLNKTKVRALPGNLSSGRNRLSLLDVQDTKLGDDVIMSSTRGIEPVVVNNNLKRASRKSAELTAGEED